MIIDTDKLRKILRITHMPFGANLLADRISEIEKVEHTWRSYESCQCFDKDDLDEQLQDQELRGDNIPQPIPHIPKWVQVI